MKCFILFTTAHRCCLVSVHYEQLFRACSNQYQGEGPTGILLVYPQHCLHLLEVMAVSCTCQCLCAFSIDRVHRN